MAGQDRHDIYKKTRERLADQLDASGVRYWKPKIGTNKIRILPNWLGPERQFFKEVNKHWGVGEKNTSVVCPSTVGRGDCPICAFVKDMYASKNEEDNKLAKSLARRERFACNILDRTGKTEGVAVFELGPSLFKDILWMFTDGDYGDLDDPKEGRDIKIERQGSGPKDTKYSAFPAAKTSSVTDEELAQAFDLDAVYRVMSNEDIEKLMTGEEAVQAETQEAAAGPAEEATEEVAEEAEEGEFIEPEKEAVVPASGGVRTQAAKPAVQKPAASAPKAAPAVAPVAQKSGQENRGAKLRERILALKGKS